MSARSLSSIQIRRTNIDSPLNYTKEEFTDRAQQIYSFFAVLQSALTIHPVKEQSIPIILNDVLGVDWSLTITESSQVGLMRRDLASGKESRILFSDQKFTYSCQELLISQPDLDELSQILGLILAGKDLPSRKGLQQEFFLSPRGAMQQDPDKYQAREIIQDYLDRSPSSIIRQPHYGLLSNYPSAQSLISNFGAKIYIKPPRDCSGDGQFVLINIHHDCSKLIASDKNVVRLIELTTGAKVAEGGVFYLSREQVDLLLSSRVVEQYVCESAIRGSTIHDKEYELRYVVAQNQDQSQAKVIGTWARRKSSTQLWCNVSRGAMPMYLSDALYELTDFCLSTADVNSKIGYKNNLFLELTKEVERLAADVIKRYPNIWRPICFDFIPFHDQKAGGVKYYLMEFQVPDNSATIGIEQFGVAGVSRRSSHDLNQANFGDVPLVY